MTLDEFLAQIEAKDNAVKKVGSVFHAAESAMNVPTLLAMLRLAIEQRNKLIQIWNNQMCGDEALVKVLTAEDIAESDAELLKLAEGKGKK